MPFDQGIEIVERASNKPFKVILQNKQNYVLTPKKFYGFSKDTKEWIFINNLIEEDYKIEQSLFPLNTFKDFFSYSGDEYKLEDMEYNVLFKCRKRIDYIPNELMDNISLIAAFAEIDGVSKTDMIKKVVCISKYHQDYALEVIQKVEQHKINDDNGIFN